MLNIFLLIFHLILRWNICHRWLEVRWVQRKVHVSSDWGSLIMCIYLGSGSWFVSSPPGLWGGEGWYRRCSADISPVALTLYVCCFRKGRKTQGLNEIWQTRPKKNKYTQSQVHTMTTQCFLADSVQWLGMINRSVWLIQLVPYRY